MYIYPRRPPPRRHLPIIVGLGAFTCTLFLLLALLLVLSPGEIRAALDLAAAKVNIATTTPTATETAVGQVPLPTRTKPPPKTATLAPTLAPTGTPINVIEHLIFGHPVAANLDGVVPGWNYLYGNTDRGTAAVHHGIDFLNPIGTPLLADGDGTVVTAGDDAQPLCGSNGDQPCSYKTSFFGNLVVIQQDSNYSGQPVFTLYGHMRSVAVKRGQKVRAGDKVGEVGDTGVAEGPHVHLEVRLGVNDYAHTRNPVLWLKPLPGRGAVAGRVQDRNGNYIRGAFVSLYAEDDNNTYIQDTETYQRDDKPPINPDDEMAENFGMADLPAGKYLLGVQIGGLNYQRHITVTEGHLTFVVFGGQ